jgi:hypothetical protein
MNLEHWYRTNIQKEQYYLLNGRSVKVLLWLPQVSHGLPLYLTGPSADRGSVLLTLSLLMSYIYGAPCKARNFNVVCIWTYFWQR